MKKITRRLSAVVLSAALAFASPCVLAQDMYAPAAQVMITMEDGSQQALSVQMLVTATGETVYWMDMSLLAEEQIAALEMGQLIVTDETGAVVMQIPLEGSDILDADGMVELMNPEDPEITYPMMVAYMPMPEDPEEAEGIIVEYGFGSDEAYAEESYDEESYGEETYDEETYDEEAYDEETYDEETYDEETYGEETYDEEAYDEETYDEETYDEETYGEETYDEEAYDEDAARIAEEEEAARRAAEEEAARKAAEEAEKLAAESEDDGQDEAEAFAVPQYVTPNRDVTNLRSEMSTASEASILTQVNTGDVLSVYGYSHDAEGNVWWQVEDYRTGYVGYILSSVVSEVNADDAAGMVAAIEAQEAAEEQEDEAGEPEIVEPEIV